MPPRRTILVEEEIYHVVNRGVASVLIYKNKFDYKRFIDIITYHRFVNFPVKYSSFLMFSKERREEIINDLINKNELSVEIMAYCLMPNHFHLLLRQVSQEGIKDFVGFSSNSYSKYFNKKYDRKGPLFQGRFRAVRIETNEQLIHVSRYIHLNPHSSFLVRDFNTLLAYPFSSFGEYLKQDHRNICKTETVLSLTGSPEKYLDFVSDNADYQRSLEAIKHELLE